MAPPPVEKPPEDLDAADLAVIDAVAAELNCGAPTSLEGGDHAIGMRPSRAGDQLQRIQFV